MRIIFIRHGEPDYENDCLTETGILQAEAVARRLQREGIREIYSSPNGRAAQTAACTARLLGLPVKQLDFMREITWGGKGIPVKGHPWTLSDWMIRKEDFDFYSEDWREHPYFKGNAATLCYDEVIREFDKFLQSYGYKQEGTRFLCTAQRETTIAVFSHGGSGACVLAHLLSMPFPYVLTVFPYDYTSVITLNFPFEYGEYVHPRVELFNDAAHIEDISSGLQLQKEIDRSRKESEEENDCNY